MVREEVAARPDLVPVALERATAGQSLAEYAGDFFHPSDTGYERYVRAFTEQLLASGVRHVVICPGSRSTSRRAWA